MAEPPALLSPAKHLHDLIFTLTWWWKCAWWVDLHTDLVMKMCVRKWKLQKVQGWAKNPDRHQIEDLGLHPKSAWCQNWEWVCGWQENQSWLLTMRQGHMYPLKTKKEGCSHKLVRPLSPPWGLIDSYIAWLYSGIFLDAKDTEPRDPPYKTPILTRLIVSKGMIRYVFGLMDSDAGLLATGMSGVG